MKSLRSSRRSSDQVLSQADALARQLEPDAGRETQVWHLPGAGLRDDGLRKDGAAPLHGGNQAIQVLFLS